MMFFYDPNKICFICPYDLARFIYSTLSAASPLMANLAFPFYYLFILFCTKVWTDNCHGRIFEATIVIVMMIIFGFGCANLMAQPKVLCFFVCL